MGANFLFPFTFLILRVQRAKHPRTIFDFASAKLEKKNETAKKNGQKVGKGYRMNKGEGIYFVISLIFADFIPSHSAVRVTCEGVRPERRIARHDPLKRAC